jgi:proline iminopeptidase
MRLSSTSFLKKDSIQTVTLNHQDYPVRVEGSGRFACLSIGTGTLIPNMLSQHFKETFTVYATDLYWDQDYKLLHPETLTIEQIALDLQSVAQQLGLEKYIIMGHSCFGIVALEVAKYDPHVQGVMMVASCPAWNEETWKFTKDYFEKHADAGRKANDQKRRAHYELIKKPTDSEISLTVYTRDSAKYWANYEVDDKTIQNVWRGLVPDDGIVNHFFCTLLPGHSVEDGLEKVQCPVLLLGGPYDFDSLPLELWKNHPATKILGQKLTIVPCPQSGHWPNIEDADIFDQETKKWAEEYLI